MRLVIANLLRWPSWAKVTLVIAVTCVCITAWLLTPTRVDIEPLPWIGHRGSYTVMVFDSPPDRMSIALRGHGRVPMENPLIYGVEFLPSEFTGMSTEELVWDWATRNSEIDSYGCPQVLLEAKDGEVVAALGADQLIRRKIPDTQKKPEGHFPRCDWRECRYEKNLPIKLSGCNPIRKMHSPQSLRGATPNAKIYLELEVDSRFPYYLLTTFDFPITSMVRLLVGSGEPHLQDAQPWLIIPNPLIHGDSGASIVQERNDYPIDDEDDYPFISCWLHKHASSAGNCPVQH